MIIGWPSNKKGPATRPASTIVYTGWHRAEVRMVNGSRCADAFPKWYSVNVG